MEENSTRRYKGSDTCTNTRNPCSANFGRWGWILGREHCLCALSLTMHCWSRESC